MDPDRSTLRFPGGNGQPKPRPMLLGDLVALTRPDTRREFAVLGTVSSRGLAVVMLCEFGKELAPVFAYPAGKLAWSPPFNCWVGELPPEPSHLWTPP